MPIRGLISKDSTSPTRDTTLLSRLKSSWAPTFTPSSFNLVFGREKLEHQCRIEEDLSAVVRRFWEQEEVLTSAPILSREEVECEEHFVRTHSRSPEGRCSVRLPVTAPLPDLSDTRRTAARALKQMEGRFIRDKSLQSLYSDFMRQYAELNHMTQVAPAPGAVRPHCCFLPHHGVMREASTSTKLRVVFNGSKVPSGETQQSPYDRTKPAASPHRHLAALAPPSIHASHRHRKMYRQIDIHPEDRNGLACAPFLVIRTLWQLAEDDGEEWPLGAAALHCDTYMDDILTGSSTIRGGQAATRAEVVAAGREPLDVGSPVASKG